MKAIKSSWFPFGKFYAINLFGTLIYKGHRFPSRRVINHELIHEAQALDFCKIKFIGYILFYIVYCIAWIVEFVKPPYNKAYSDICFEKEAKMQELNYLYLKSRKRFSCFKNRYLK